MSDYYGNNDWRDYLALKHYGVKGMKWHQHIFGDDGLTGKAKDAATDAVAKIRRKKWKAKRLVNKVLGRNSGVTYKYPIGPNKPGGTSKPLRRKKKVTSGGSGVHRTGYSGWYTYLLRAGRDVRKDKHSKVGRS